LQNKAKFQKVKSNVNQVLTKDYEQMDTWSIRKNEPKTNPNEPKTNPISEKVKFEKAKQGEISSPFRQRQGNPDYVCCFNFMFGVYWFLCLWPVSCGQTYRHPPHSNCHGFEGRRDYYIVDISMAAITIMRPLPKLKNANNV